MYGRTVCASSETVSLSSVPRGVRGSPIERVPHIHSLIFVILLGVASLAGCRSLLGRPDEGWIDDLARTDMIELRSDDSSARLTDAADISRLNDIYTNARWETYWHTLPADVTDRKIALWSDGHELRRFSYTGSLWELNASDGVRTAKLDADDCRWLDSLFAELRSPDEGGEP